MRILFIILTLFTLFFPTIIVAGQPITVIDQAGRTITIPQPVTRIVSSHTPATFFVFALGLADKLVGVSNADPHTALYRAVIKEDQQITTIGNRGSGLNLESIISLKPDLVIMYAQKDGVRTADRLEGLGIPAIVISPESFSAMDTTLHLLGKACGQSDSADRVINAMARIETSVKARVQAEPRPRVYYAANTILRTVSGTMLQNEMIGLSGGENVSKNTKGYFVNISREQLLAWNPEVILLGDKISKETIKSLETGILASLPASRNNNIYQLPLNTFWDFPSPFAMAGVLWMGNCIHSDAFKGVDVQEEITHFYTTLLGPDVVEAFPSIVGNKEAL